VDCGERERFCPWDYYCLRSGLGCPLLLQVSYPQPSWGGFGIRGLRRVHTSAAARMGHQSVDNQVNYPQKLPSYPQAGGRTAVPHAIRLTCESQVSRIAGGKPEWARGRVSGGGIALEEPFADSQPIPVQVVVFFQEPGYLVASIFHRGMVASAQGLADLRQRAS
jgi:hypothetical protein